MIEDTYLTVWAEELVDTIVTSICDVISKEGVNNPVSVVEREYKRLPPEKQFLLQYVVAVYWGEGHEVMYETLAKQNIVDVLLPGSKNTVKMGIGVQQNREQEYSKNGNKNTVISINIINQGLHCIINKKQDCDGLKNKITYHYVSRDSQAS